MITVSWCRTHPPAYKYKVLTKIIFRLNYLVFCYICIIFATENALVAKLADALDLGSSGSHRVGSSPIWRTRINRKPL